jgi:hypothetical protein
MEKPDHCIFGFSGREQPLRTLRTDDRSGHHKGL